MAHPEEIFELGKLTFALVIVLLFFTWTTVALRMWVRMGITKSPGWDDATIVIAMYVQLSEIFYILTTTFLKISLGLFFLRLLTKPWQTRLFQTVLVISGVYGIFYFFATVFVCGNPSKLAESLLGARTTHCAPIWFVLSTGYIYGIINVIADWIFTLIPIVILKDSTMDRRSKISVAIVMGFAAVGSISSIMRMVYLKGLLFEGNVSTASIKATIWATAEPGTGIVAASAAILRPLFRKIYTDVREKYGKSSQQDPTMPWTTATTRVGDTESVIGLTTVATKTSRHSMRSLELDEPWNGRTSIEQARIGIGRSVVITAGQEVRTVPLRKK
ncbi:uncharacterized protein N0V89_000901 [Didymosphaeria variabile]|uniref:Rhodopsin domain-containing protein n=1 Tax=Didymosphaeria variabile TaxID=1932322 RepID=A0A9W8XV68_9PLEO|nr:uncharacterized protein N0V89_000901 [Didymosphaeria variabile]KAJ4360339.1 hypothetical protein N0V89_000901 [Didymosphaeria variabile]